MIHDPVVCPFCEGGLLQETDPTEIRIDDETWTIYHWQCLECAETFDRVEVNEEDDFAYEQTLFDHGELDN